MIDEYIFCVTDIEADGPDPGKNSMMSIGSVAVDGTGRIIGEFFANFKALDQAKPDPETMKWWQENLEAYNKATLDPDDPESNMRLWVKWLRSFGRKVIFTAHPLTFDSVWVDWYLQNFGLGRLFDRPREPGITFGTGLDISSIIIPKLRSIGGRTNYPTHWFGGFEHDHSALSDARGYANILKLILQNELD